MIHWSDRDYITGMGPTIEVSGVVPRGHILVHPRDYQDAFTRRPTRSDFELEQMVEASRRLFEETD